MREIQSAPWMHIVGQFRWHDEAIITGSLSALEALRSAIDEALATGDGAAGVFASDGEGYTIKVRLTSTMLGLGQPVYYEQVGRDIARQEEEMMAAMRKDLRKRRPSPPAFMQERETPQHKEPPHD